MKLKSKVQDWLEDCGYELGYDMDSLPPLSEFEEIKLNRIKNSKSIFVPEPSDVELNEVEIPSDVELEELEWDADNNPDDGSWFGR